MNKEFNLSKKLRCSICTKEMIDCSCTDDDGDKWEIDLEQDLFLGSDVETFINKLKESILGMNRDYYTQNQVIKRIDKLSGKLFAKNANTEEKE